MEVSHISNGEGARHFVEGVLNDLDAGILSRDEALHNFFEYSKRMVEIGQRMGFETSKKYIIGKLEEAEKDFKKDPFDWLTTAKVRAWILQPPKPEANAELLGSSYSKEKKNLRVIE